jgi:hypothetical protein
MKTAPHRVVIVLTFFLVVPTARGQEEMPAEIIAAQIRDQGYVCDKAVSAKRDENCHGRMELLGSSNVRMPHIEFASSPTWLPT